MTKGILDRLSRSQFAIDVGVLVRGNIVSHLVQLVALPIIARIYSPDEFGAFALFLAFYSVSSVLVSLRMDSAILIAEPDDIEVLVEFSIRCVLFTSALLTIIFIVATTKGLFGFELLDGWHWPLMFLALCGIGLYNIGRSICLRSGNASQIAQSQIVKAVGGTVSKIIAGFFCQCGLGLALGECVAAWCALRSVRVQLIARAFLWRNRILHLARAIIGRYRKFPLFELPATFFDQATSMLPVPMMVIIGGAEIAGAYAMARMVVVVPNAQIGIAVADAFQTKIAAVVRSGEKRRIASSVWKTIGLLAIIGIAPYAAFAALSPWMFALILGSDWYQAGKIASLLAIWMYFAFVVSPIIRVISVIERQELKLIIDLITFSFICVYYGFAISSGFTAHEFIVGIVMINIVRYLLFLATIGSILYVREH